jgi:hypothetical protein
MVSTSINAMQCSSSSRHASPLHVPFVLDQPQNQPWTWRDVASLLSTDKQTAAAVTASLAGQLQKLSMPITSSTKVEAMKAWLVKHAALVQGAHTLELYLQLTDDILSTSAAAGILSLLSSELGHTTAANALPIQAAAAILQHMPGKLKTLELKLQSPVSTAASVGRRLCSQVTALLQVLQQPLTSAASSSAAAAAAAHTSGLPTPGFLSSHLTNMTSLKVTNVHYVKGLQLLRHLPTSLQDLHLDLTADSSTWRRMMHHPNVFKQLDQQQQQSMQMGHLKELLSLKITNSTDLTLTLGRNSQLPPNLQHLEAPCMYVMSSAPILQLSRLQYLEVGSFHHLYAAEAAAISSMPQLAYVAGISYDLWEDPEALQDPEEAAAFDEAVDGLLAAFVLPNIKKVKMSVRPAAADSAQPSSLVSRLSSLTNLASLIVAGGFHDEDQLAASIAQLTSLTELNLLSPPCNPVRLVGAGDTPGANLMQAVASLKHLRRLEVADGFFAASAAGLDGQQQHPIQNLQAATQLTCLELYGAWSLGMDFAALVGSLPGLESSQSLQELMAVQQRNPAHLLASFCMVLVAQVFERLLIFVEKVLIRMGLLQLV